MLNSNIGYSIDHSLPLWWSEDLLIKIINEYSGDQEFKYIYELITNRIEQPVQCWKEALREENKIIKRTFETINQSIQLPITKYPTRGKITIEIQKGHPDNYLKNLTLKNGTQTVEYINPKIKADKITYDLNLSALYIDGQLSKTNTEQQAKKIIDDKWQVYNIETETYEDTGYNASNNEPYVKNKTWFIDINTEIPAVPQTPNPYIEEENWFVYDAIQEVFVDSNYEQNNKKPYIENDYWYVYDNETQKYRNSYVIGLVRNEPYIEDGYLYLYNDEEKKYINIGDAKYFKNPIIKDNVWYVNRNLNIPASNLIDRFEDEYNASSSTLYKNKIELQIESEEEIISSFNNIYNITIEMEKPIFTVEQNIKLSTLTFLPLKSIELYGLYDFKFNPNENGWKSLWKKSYQKKDKIVYDRITKQFPVEKFIAEVQLWGLNNPIQIGFPQEKETDDERFLINPNLDKFGKIYGLPRRDYKKEIDIDDEIRTFPIHYPYPVEQDYWYERRLLSEYVLNEDKINSTFLKDNDNTSLIRIQSTDPFIEELVVMTETNEPNYDIYFTETEPIYPLSVVQNDFKDNVEWSFLDNIMSDSDNYSNAQIRAKSGNYVTNEKYKSKSILMKFDLNFLPNDIKIEGVEILVDVIADNGYANKKDDERTMLLLPKDGDIEEVPCQQSKIIGTRRQILKFGGKKDLFNQARITREQLVDEDFGFQIGITNNDSALNSSVTIFNAKMIIYYRKKLPLYLLSADINPRIVEIDGTANLKVKLINIGDVKLENKVIKTLASSQLELDRNEIVINELEPDDTIEENITITGIQKGFWNIMTFLDGKTSTNNLMVK